MGLLGSNQIIGIDLGHGSIKVVGITAGRNPKVLGFGCAETDPRNLQREGLEDGMAAVDALKTALNTASPHPLKGKTAYLSISEAAVFRKILEIPRTKDAKEMNAMVRSGIVEYLPEDLDALELDYQPLPTADSAENQQVMVVAVNKRVIELYLELCKKAGLRVESIDPKPSSVLRAAVPFTSKEPVALVDIGSEISTVMLAAQGVIWVAGTVNQGGKILRDPVTGQIDEATKDEKLKRLAMSLVDELDHVVKFYLNRTANPNDKPTEVILCGGAALTTGLVDIFSKESGMKARLAAPTVKVPEGFEARYIGALGAALYPLYETL